MAQSHHAPHRPTPPRMLCASMDQRELDPIMLCNCMDHRGKPQSHHALRLGKRALQSKGRASEAICPRPTMLCAPSHSPVPPDLGRGSPVPSGPRTLAAQAQTGNVGGALHRALSCAHAPCDGENAIGNRSCAEASGGRLHSEDVRLRPGPEASIRSAHAPRGEAMSCNCWQDGLRLRRGINHCWGGERKEGIKLRSSLFSPPFEE